MASKEKPLFSFGVVADVQHAEVPDGSDFFKLSVRRYRSATVRLDEACKHFKTENVDFVAQLGDLIDGKSRFPPVKEGGQNKTLSWKMEGRELLTEVERAGLIWDNNLVPCFEKNGFEFYGKKSEKKEKDRKFVHNVVGNHELYCFPRPVLSQKLYTPEGRPRHYYSFSPHPSFCVIVLDAFDFSTLNGDPNETSRAYAVLQKRNPNDVKANVDWFTGLTGVAKRWVPFNGQVGFDQLVWLEEELRRASEEDQKVIILSHSLLCEGVARPAALAWNYEAVLSILHREPCVVAVLAGHDHRQGYLQDKQGIHHWSVPAILESATSAHAVLRVFSDRICIEGSGDIPSCIWPFADAKENKGETRSEL